MIVQPNDLTAIEALAQQKDLVVRARLTVRQYRWREQGEDLFSPASMQNIEVWVAYLHFGCNQGFLAGAADGEMLRQAAA